MDPEELADAYTREGDLLAAAKRFGEALILYERAIGVCPESGAAWTGKAVVLKILDRRREALECVEEALEIGPYPVAEMLRESLIDEMRRRGELR